MRGALLASAMDVREQIFASLEGQAFRAVLTACGRGVLSGQAAAQAQTAELGFTLAWEKAEGSLLEAGDILLRLRASAMGIARAEERLMGCLCKPSGIATAARRASELAGGRIRVVSGAWKKMPPALKDMVRQAVTSGGLASRLVDQPFVYLDKNYVRMLGGITATLQAVKAIPGAKVIQLRGEEADIAEETRRACLAGADVVMVDTGRRADASAALATAGDFPQVRVAFAGNLHIDEIPSLADLGVHILDIGAAILDAPLLDMRLDVIGALRGI
jgi:nicotinate-nucleotide pyrophosphorylase (carboxylating)